MTEAIKLALKLQLLTAQRKGEVIAAQWEDFDLAAKVWTIPAEKAKNGLSHRVPLSPQALDLLSHIKRLSGDSPYLFPSPRIGYITPTAVDHAVRRNLLVFGIKHFTPHDLRRTAASHMTGALGIFRLVVSKILNHVEAGVTSVYDRHSYDLDKQKALEAWGARLEQLLEADTPSVIYLKRR